MVTCCALCGADLSYGLPAGVFGYTDERCPDCGLAPQSDVAPLVPTDEEMTYDFGEWEPGDRLALRAVLVERDVPFRWEPRSVLVIHEDDVGLVEEVLDELDQVEDLGGGGDPSGADLDVVDDSGQAQAVMGDLFVVADRLVRDVWDPQLGAELESLTAAADASGPPYGVEARVWNEIRRQAHALGALIAGLYSVAEGPESVDGGASDGGNVADGPPDGGGDGGGDDEGDDEGDGAAVASARAMRDLLRPLV